MPTSNDTCALALRLMSELGREVLGEPLQDRGWTFGFDRAKTRLGACRPKTKRITLSAHLSRSLPAAEVEDTVRHEIAHALDFELNPDRRGRRAHDRVWKALARRCGAKPERCYAGDMPDDPDAPYACTCPGCGATLDRYRQPATPLRCRACTRAGRPAYFRVVHRASGAVVWPGGATPGDYGGTAGVEATCSQCGAVYRRTRRLKKATACAPCCRRHARGRYDDRFRLAYSSWQPGA